MKRDAFKSPLMSVKAKKEDIQKPTALQRIHAWISERWLVDANICFESTGRSK